MNDQNNRAKDPMEGITLKMMLADLIEVFGHQGMFEMTEVRSFDDDYPQFDKILKFIRKNKWAIQKIEKMYRDNIELVAKMKRNKEENSVKKEETSVKKP